MLMTEVVTITVAVIASSGLWGLLQFLISRRDKTAEKLDSIIRAIREVSDRVDANSATLARTHILRFDDELINGVHHSREYFQQTLEDVDTYEKYCAAHPDYKNNTCVLAIEHIRRVYATLQDKGF
jgi:hypothetical protein